VARVVLLVEAVVDDGVAVVVGLLHVSGTGVRQDKLSAVDASIVGGRRRR
jgi:hypothetical protein